MGYGPNEGGGEERGRFWNDTYRILDRVGNGYRLYSGDLKGWIGDIARAGITGGFKVPGENDNGRRAVESCAEMELCVSNTYFEHNITKGWRGVNAEGRQRAC